MKKTLSLLLAVLLMLSCMSIPAFAETKTFTETISLVGNGENSTTFYGNYANVSASNLTANGCLMDNGRFPKTLTITAQNGYTLSNISFDVSEVDNSAYVIYYSDSSSQSVFLGSAVVQTYTLDSSSSTIKLAAFNGYYRVKSVTITATPLTYAITNGTPETSINTNYGCIASLSAAEAPSGDIVTVVLKPENGYNFVEAWYESTSGGNKTFITTSAETQEENAVARSFSMPNYPVTVYASFAKAGVSVTLTPSAEKINAGETVTVTVTAEGEQNCADITLTYDANTFDYIGAADDENGKTAVKVSDGTIRILNADTAETINTLTFTSKNTLTETVDAAKFEITSAKFAESLAAMDSNAEDAAAVSNTAVKVNVIKNTVKFMDGTTEKKTKVYYGENQTIAENDIPGDPEKTGYKFNGWSYGNTVYTADQLIGMKVTADITYKADYSLDVTVDIQTDYVHGKETNYTKVVVTGTLDGYTYDGNEMYKVADNTFAYIVAGRAFASYVAVSENMAVDISVTNANDVNGTGKIDIADARAVYNCVNNNVSVDEYMEVYIRADVNNSKAVDAADVAAIINALK